MSTTNGFGRNNYKNLLAATALGDSLGLAYENMPGRRVRAITNGELKQRFVLGWRGMVSDDTEHALMTARALMDAQDDVEVFERQLSKRLKRWLQTFPPAAGKATITSIFLMWFKKPSRCGRPSAGNGPLMRAPIIGLYYAHDESARDDFISMSTKMTHADPRATFMAAGIADIIAHSASGKIHWPQMSMMFRLAASRHSAAKDEAYITELTGLLDILDESYEQGHALAHGLAEIGCEKGIDGYVYRSALGAAYIASHSRDYLDAIERSVMQGGDTDSTAALAAAILAVGVSDQTAIPLKGICDWPISENLVAEHAECLHWRQKCEISEPGYIPLFLRNLVFIGLDMGHIIRRALPPYR